MKPSLLTYTVFYKNKGGIHPGGTRYLRKAVFSPVQGGSATVQSDSNTWFCWLLPLQDSTGLLEFFLWFDLWDGSTVQLHNSYGNRRILYSLFQEPWF